jgi:asparagine synthase (glutamine-hydrolysing)
MCGIIGYLYLDGQTITDTSVINKMLLLQKHRGPDDSGIRSFSFKNKNSHELQVNEITGIPGSYEGVLGFNRLSILDLSLAGHQPMVSPDEKVLLVLNGEIYNAFDYKSELENWGYRFKSKSDTEVVLALYLKYGFDDMLMKLNGMFAIVIIDLHQGDLYIARDRFGIKPIYYVLSEEVLAFSSELKSFKYLNNFNFKLDEKQIDEYLIFRSNLSGTLFKGINLLDPGHYISFSHEIGLKKVRYFNINDYSRNKNSSNKLEFFEQELEECLRRSIKSQLISDVKLGCQLSGGIDSSLVTFLAAKESNDGYFESVSIIFNNSKFSEETYIDKVANLLHLNSHKFLLDASYYIKHFENATWHFESPLNHPNTIGIYLLSQRAKEVVTVLLSGEGADEVFGGYRRFYDISYPFSSKWFLHLIKENFFNPGQIFSLLNTANRTIMVTAYMNPILALKLYPDFKIARATESRFLLYNSLNGTVFDKQVKYEMQSYMPDLLVRQDKMSMAHSIENRVPYLDNFVVENSFKIPEKFLLTRTSSEGRNTEKYLLKKVVSNFLGNEFAFRDKMGFGIPLKEFFQTSLFKAYLDDKLLPGIKNRGFFNFDRISKWTQKIDKLQYDEMESLWIILAFEIWAEKFLDC